MNTLALNDIIADDICKSLLSGGLQIVQTIPVSAGVHKVASSGIQVKMATDLTACNITAVHSVLLLQPAFALLLND